ncbi:MAG: serine hydrolase, partial [Anaerolineaceae bacterium]
ILSKHTLEEMHTVHWLDKDWQMGWGWGFEVLRLKGKTFVGHGGSLMGFRTNFMFNPEEKIAVITLTNSDDGEPALINERVYDWLSPALLKQYAPKAEKKPADPAWQKLVGRYRSPWGDMQIFIRNDELIVIDPSLDDPMLAVTRLIPIGENRFRIEDKGGFGSPGEETVFEFDENGKVCRIQSGMSYTYPIDRW